MKKVTYWIDEDILNNSINDYILSGPMFDDVVFSYFKNNTRSICLSLFNFGSLLSLYTWPVMYTIPKA